MKLQAGFIFLAPEADFTKDFETVVTPQVELTAVGAKNYEDARQAALQLEKKGVTAIELCGGFGIDGTAKIKQAVDPKIAVGVVRFENHPGLGNQSGDNLFKG